MGPTAYGDLVTDISATALYTVGVLREVDDPTYGRQVYRYAKLDTGVAGVVGGPIMVKNGAISLATQVGVLALDSTASVRLLGVPQVVVTSGYYAWLLVDGKGLFLAGTGATTADTAQKVITAGNGFVDGAIGTDELPVIAHATTADGATFVGTIHVL